MIDNCYVVIVKTVKAQNTQSCLIIYNTSISLLCRQMLLPGDEEWYCRKMAVVKKKEMDEYV